MNGRTNGLYDGLLTGQANGLFDGLNNGLNNGLFNNETVIDTNALRFIAAIGTLTDLQSIAIIQLVQNLKLYKIWDKFKVIYPFVGGNASAHKFNLINPLDSNDAFRLTFVGGWTHSETGALPNGTNAYANSNFQAYRINSLNISYYSRTNNTSSSPDFMHYASGQPAAYLYIRDSANTSYLRVNTGGAGTESSLQNLNGTGFYQINRIRSTTQTYIKNNIITNFNVSSTGIPTGSMIFGGGFLLNAFAFGNKQCAFASISDGLTNTEAITFYNIVQNFQRLLNRAV